MPTIGPQADSLTGRLIAFLQAAEPGEYLETQDIVLKFGCHKHLVSAQLDYAVRHGWIKRTIQSGPNGQNQLPSLWSLGPVPVKIQSRRGRLFRAKRGDHGELELQLGRRVVLIQPAEVDVLRTVLAT